MKWIVLDKLAGIILSHCHGPIVEIGMGESTRILARHAKDSSVKLYSCDVKRFNPANDNHHVFCGTSLNFIKQFNDRPALVFLDGCHDFAVVSQEVDFFLKVIAPGGVIFMHDTLPQTQRHLRRDRCSDAYRVRKELEERPDVNCFTWPYTANGCGLTMVQGRPECVVDQISPE